MPFDFGVHLQPVSKESLRKTWLSLKDRRTANIYLLIRPYAILLLPPVSKKTHRPWITNSKIQSWLAAFLAHRELIMAEWAVVKIIKRISIPLAPPSLGLTEFGSSNYCCCNGAKKRRRGSGGDNSYARAPYVGPTKGILSRFYYFGGLCTVWKYTECSLLWCLNQARISKDRKVTVSCNVGSQVEDIAIVPDFFACSSYRPQRLKTPLVGAGRNLRMTCLRAKKQAGVFFLMITLISSCLFRLFVGMFEEDDIYI